MVTTDGSMPLVSIVASKWNLNMANAGLPIDSIRDGSEGIESVMASFTVTEEITGEGNQIVKPGANDHFEGKAVPT